MEIQKGMSSNPEYEINRTIVHFTLAAVGRLWSTKTLRYNVHLLLHPEQHFHTKHFASVLNKLNPVSRKKSSGVRIDPC